MLDGAFGRGADAVIADLEDAVAPAAKDVARATVVDWLATIASAAATGSTAEVWVRINADPTWQQDDLAALGALPSHAAPVGVLVPKASPALVASVRDTLATSDEARGLRVAGLVEDARALVDLAALAGTPGLSHLGLGEADLRADLRLDPSDDEAELRPLRLAVVVASAAAGIQPPVGPTATDFRDLDGLRRSSDRLRRLGFAGRTAIHPRQVPVINEVFTPTDQQVAAARRLMDDLEAATADGRGVVTDADGRMVDEAVARQARHTLELAEADRRRPARD